MAVLDRIFTVPALPTGATKAYATSFREVGGGPASTASAAIVRLGGRARLFARVGEDAVGDTILAELAREGVHTTGVRRISGAQSAWSAVAVDPAGERLILNTPGSGLDVPPDWVTDVAGSGAVLADMGWPRAAAHVFQLARAAGIPTVLDADLGPDPSAASLFSMADHVIFSAAALSHHSRQTDPKSGLDRMRDLAPDAVLGVTLGADGYLWLEGRAVRHSAGLRVRAVDTLGAGDVFHGAYALALAEGRGVADAARFANVAAGLKCTRPGGRAGIPGRDEVDAALSSGTGTPGRGPPRAHR